MPTPRRTLNRHQARRLIAESCFTPSATNSIGLELEFLTFVGDDRTVRPDLTAMRAAIPDPLPHRSRVTFEPGGQVEVSALPQPTAGAAIATTTRDVGVLRSALAAIDVETVAVGVDTWRSPCRLLDTPRYRAMEAHFDAGGPDGRRMMCNTAALQINVDLGADDRRWRAAHAIGPALIAAFANSPAGGWKSARLATWLQLDPRAHRADSRPAARGHSVGRLRPGRARVRLRGRRRRLPAVAGSRVVGAVDRRRPPRCRLSRCGRRAAAPHHVVSTGPATRAGWRSAISTRCRRRGGRSPPTSSPRVLDDAVVDDALAAVGRHRRPLG